MSLKSIEEKLPPKIFRIHKSYIIAVSHITTIRRNSVFLGDLELPLSELYKDDLMKEIGQGKNKTEFGRWILTLVSIQS
jgi:DNA-binding LytR/AlgR family response regulator